MSEFSPQPPTGPPPAPAPAAPPGPGRRGGLIVVVAVVALLVGVGGTAAAFLLYEPVMERLDPPEYTYQGSVFLKADVTAAQREALGAALDGIDALGGVRYESREEAYRKFKEIYKDSPDLVEKVRPDTLPESFRFETTGTNKNFDCAVLNPVKQLPGIDDISVMRFSRDDKKSPVRQLSCS